MDLLLYSPWRTTIHLFAWTFFFFIWKFSLEFEELGDFLKVLSIWKSWTCGASHGLCAQAALRGLETHLAEPALPRAPGPAPPLDVLVRGAAAQAFQPELTQMLWLKFPRYRKLAGKLALHISSAKIRLEAVCIHGALCAGIPSLSRGVMSPSLILALEGADGAKILHLRARITVWSQLHRFH